MADDLRKGDWTEEELALSSEKARRVPVSRRALERHLAAGGENTPAVRKRVIEQAVKEFREGRAHRVQ